MKANYKNKTLLNHCDIRLIVQIGRFPIDRKREHSEVKTDEKRVCFRVVYRAIER